MSSKGTSLLVSKVGIRHDQVCARAARCHGRRSVAPPTDTGVGVSARMRRMATLASRLAHTLPSSDTSPLGSGAEFLTPIGRLN